MEGNKEDAAVERWGGGWNKEDTVRVTCAMCETFYSTTLRTVCTIFTFPFIHRIYLVFYLKRLHRNKRVSQKKFAGVRALMERVACRAEKSGALGG